MIAITPALRTLFASVLILLGLFGLTPSPCGAEAEGPTPQLASPQNGESDKWDGERIYAISEPNLFRHNIGPLDLMVTNVAIFGNPGFIDGYGAEWRGGEYLYAAGIWIGAIAPDNLPYVSTGPYEIELRPSLDPVDTIYPSYEGIPGGNRIGFSEEADDDDDGVIDEDFHNGKDDDADARVDEDFGAISEQMFSCEYWDYTEEAMQAYPQHRPLFVRVRQKSIAWSVPGIDEFVGVELEVINDGFEVLRGVYLGMFVDGDVGPRNHPGYYGDDGGFVYLADTTLVDPTLADCESLAVRIDLAYMYDIPDNGADAHGGDVEGFFGLLYLGSTTDPKGGAAPTDARIHTARFFQSSGSYPAADPRNDLERYDALSSGNIINRPTGTPNDYKYLVSVGPFPELLPGASLELHFAFVIGEGYFDAANGTPHPELGADGLPSEHSLLANATRARLVYEGRWKDIDGIAVTGVEGRETCIATEPGEAFVWVNPCDSSDVRIFNGSTCDDPDSWVDNDCDPCTPNPAHEGCGGGGCERLIHWYTLPAIAAVPGQPVRKEDVARALRLVSLCAPTPPPVEFRTILARPMDCSVRIYDVAGRLVSDLGRRRLPVGTSDWAWDGHTRVGETAAPGIYFLRAAGDGDATTARPFVLLRR